MNLNLSYYSYNQFTLEVCTDTHLLLGHIKWNPMFRQISFSAVTELSQQDKQELNYVANMLQKVMQ